MPHRDPSPDLAYEIGLWAAGQRRVAGLDEAGRGAWAGPVVAGAVILPADPATAGRLPGVRDSKQLSPAQREACFALVRDWAVALGVGCVPAADIDALGIVAATRRAMLLALQAIDPPPDCLLIDYLSLPELALPQTCLPKGDSRVLSIAAASIVAKVSRDRLMVALDAELPGYGFARHKGYGTAQHQAALAALGPSREHRLSFEPVGALRR